MNIRSTKIFHQNGSVNSSMLDSESIKMIKSKARQRRKSISLITMIGKKKILLRKYLALPNYLDS